MSPCPLLLESFGARYEPIIYKGVMIKESIAEPYRERFAMLTSSIRDYAKCEAITFGSST